MDAEGDVTWSAELGDHDEHGVEAPILRDGDAAACRRTRCASTLKRLASCRCPTRPSKGEGYGWLVMERSPPSAALHEGMV